MIKEVTGCSDCPFVYELESGSCLCLHDDSPQDSYLEDGETELKTPEWCPLKKEEVTIKFKTE